jgi:hypothetical protein
MYVILKDMAARGARIRREREPHTIAFTAG